MDSSNRKFYQSNPTRSYGTRRRKEDEDYNGKNSRNNEGTEKLKIVKKHDKNRYMSKYGTDIPEISTNNKLIADSDPSSNSSPSLFSPSTLPSQSVQFVSPQTSKSPSEEEQENQNEKYLKYGKYTEDYKKRPTSRISRRSYMDDSDESNDDSYTNDTQYNKTSNNQNKSKSDIPVEYKLIYPERDINSGKIVYSMEKIYSLKNSKPSRAKLDALPSNITKATRFDNLRSPHSITKRVPKTRLLTDGGINRKKKNSGVEWLSSTIDKNTTLEEDLNESEKDRKRMFEEFMKNKRNDGDSSAFFMSVDDNSNGTALEELGGLEDNEETSPRNTPAKAGRIARLLSRKQQNKQSRNANDETEYFSESQFLTSQGLLADSHNNDTFGSDQPYNIESKLQNMRIDNSIQQQHLMQKQNSKKLFEMITSAKSRNTDNERNSSNNLADETDVESLEKQLLLSGGNINKDQEEKYKNILNVHGNKDNNMTMYQQNMYRQKNMNIDRKNNEGIPPFSQLSNYPSTHSMYNPHSSEQIQYSNNSMPYAQYLQQQQYYMRNQQNQPSYQNSHLEFEQQKRMSAHSTTERQSNTMFVPTQMLRHNIANTSNNFQKINRMQEAKSMNQNYQQQIAQPNYQQQQQQYHNIPQSMHQQIPQQQQQMNYFMNQNNMEQPMYQMNKMNQPNQTLEQKQNYFNY